MVNPHLEKHHYRFLGKIEQNVPTVHTELSLAHATYNWVLYPMLPSMLADAVNPTRFLLEPECSMNICTTVIIQQRQRQAVVASFQQILQ
jgi:hypothetical protein